MTIERVIVKNYRGLRSADIRFGSSINVIVGDNEAGKSTLLEAINLALRGQINRRPAAYELHPFLFNREAVKEFVGAVQRREQARPPEILIEVYFTASAKVAEFQGFNNSLRDDRAHGVSFKICLDGDNFDAEYEDYIRKAENVKDIPVEYYMIEWRSFAWGTSLSSQAVPVKSALIDPSSISNTYAANKYVVEIVRDHLDPPDRVDLAVSYRGMRELFQQDDRIGAINEKLAAQAGVVSEKTLSIALDVTTRASWETGVLPHLDDIPLTLVGKGEQNAVKIKLALANQRGCELFLMEEPENHLSHTNLGRLIASITDTCGDKQLIVTTHNSFVLNKLGVDNVIMFNGSSGVTLNDLPESTRSYFKRLPGHDTLRMILAHKTILVEGPSDELIVQKAFQQAHGRLPLQAGVEVIAVGTSFKRYLDIAARLGLNVSVVRDNDGDAAGKIELFTEYAVADGVRICIDRDDTTPTLEPQMVKANGRGRLNDLLGQDFQSDSDLIGYMVKNKTDVALRLFEYAGDIIIPQYIQDAIQ
jgi:predicted ATP-dependent endonuclease of OLD family